MKNETVAIAQTSLSEMLNDSSIDGIIAINNNWCVTAWNRTAEIMTGKARHNVMEKHLLEVLPAAKKDMETTHAIAQAFKGFKAFVPASELYSHRIQLENYFIPLRDKHDNLVGVMNIMHDVAHRIKVEMRLRELNDKLEDRYRQLQRTTSELASFTLLTSNNIKTPIRTIYTTIEQLIKIESGQLSNNGKAAFRRMQSSLNKMNLLLEDMLGLAQISVPEEPAELLDLELLVANIVPALKNRIKEKEIQVVINKLCSVTGHPQQLQLLFHHLISNAVKFNNSSTPLVTLDCTNTTVNKVKDGSSVEKEYYCVTVADNGIGIESKDFDKIFNMFEKLHPEQHYKGSGMGLAMVRKIMYAHEGFIEVESVLGKGSSFNCYFPVDR